MSWMWRDPVIGIVRGIQVDVDAGTLRWYDEPGCACVGSNAEQTIEDFLERGIYVLDVPEDIMAEIFAVLEGMVADRA